MMRASVTCCDPRQNCSSGLGVIDVLRSKLLTHELLFFESLDGERNPECQNRKDPAIFIQRHRGSGRSDNQTGVDRMSYEAVRSCADKLVVFLDGDVGAPVTTEHNTCPVGHAETERGDRYARPADPCTIPVN